MQRRNRLRFAGLIVATALWLPPVSAGASEPGDDSSSLPWGIDHPSCRMVPIPPAGQDGSIPEDCPGVRPGAVVRPSGCTLNFLFQGYRRDELGNWVEADRYIGTAGHCLLDEEGEERSWPPGQGVVAQDGQGRRIGEEAYAILTADKDFALIRLDPDVQANPSMCHWGGPTGINEDLTSQPTVLRHFGQGLALGTVAPARTAVAAFGMQTPRHVFATGAVIFGDSGSGVISDDGRAVGVAVTVGLNMGSPGPNAFEAGIMGITRLAPQVARAEEVLDLDLRLVTAPRTA